MDYEFFDVNLLEIQFPLGGTINNQVLILLVDFRDCTDEGPGIRIDSTELNYPGINYNSHLDKPKRRFLKLR